jgi:hypothetical protein
MKPVLSNVEVKVAGVSEGRNKLSQCSVRATEGALSKEITREITRRRTC